MESEENRLLIRVNKKKYNKKLKYNDGSIKIIKNKQVEMKPVKEFLWNVSIDDEDCDEVFDILYNSKLFRALIPDYGEYILNNGSRVSVNDFLNKYFIPYYKTLNTKSKIPYNYKKFLEKNVLSAEKTSIYNTLTNLKVSYDNKINIINTLKNSRIVNDPSYYIEEDIHDKLNVIYNINEEYVSEELYDYMINRDKYNNNKNYYEFDVERLRYFRKLLEVCDFIANDSALNPANKDYSSIFTNNGNVKQIFNEIEIFDNKRQKQKARTLTKK